MCIWASLPKRGKKKVKFFWHQSWNGKQSQPGTYLVQALAKSKTASNYLKNQAWLILDRLVSMISIKEQADFKFGPIFRPQIQGQEKRCFCCFLTICLLMHCRIGEMPSDPRSVVVVAVVSSSESMKIPSSASDASFSCCQHPVNFLLQD